MKLPQAKTDNIVVQELKGELLVYNLATHQAYTLNETLKIVYSACDGQMSFDDLKRKYKFADDLIHLALAELSAKGLLADYQSDHFNGLSRREAVKKVGLASMIALPLIVGITAPSAAHAQSVVRCPAGQTFVNGRCVCTNSGSTPCSGSNCPNLQTDPNNCGQCGNVCPTNQNCVSGVCRQNAQTGCTPACAAGQVCNPALGICVSPQVACTNDAQCATGQVCNIATGTCQQSTQPDCSSGGVRCPSGQICAVTPNGNVCVTP